MVKFVIPKTRTNKFKEMKSPLEDGIKKARGDLKKRGVPGVRMQKKTLWLNAEKYHQELEENALKFKKEEEEMLARARKAREELRRKEMENRKGVAAEGKRRAEERSFRETLDQEIEVFEDVRCHEHSLVD